MTETTVRYLPVSLCGCAVVAIALVFVVVVFYYVILGMGKKHQEDDSLSRDVQNRKEKEVKEVEVKVTRLKWQVEREKFEKMCGRHGLRVKRIGGGSGWPSHPALYGRGLFSGRICEVFRHQLECQQRNLKRTKEIANAFKREPGWGDVSILVIRNEGFFD